MSKQQIKSLIEARTKEPGMMETGIPGVQIFRHVEPMLCAPVVYEPCIVAIVSGAKEVILDGTSYVYGSDKYLCCPISMPAEAGMREASPENPLLGAVILLDTRVMTELVIGADSTAGTIRSPERAPSHGFTLAEWDDSFTDALLRLLQLGASPRDVAVLGNGRLREVYYAILNGDAGFAARRAFGVGNEIARSIEFLTTCLHEPVSIDEMAAQAGMSRAVFHRKFKQATMMSPIQFVKSMRLNNAAMKIAAGMTVNSAAMDVGYVSSSQFSREFKRLYGQSPRQWSQSQQIPAIVTLNA